MPTEQEYAERSRKFLSDSVPPGSKIYSLFIRQRGKGRLYRVFAVIGGDIREITRSVAQVTGLPWIDLPPSAAIQLNGTGFSGPQAIAEKVGEAVFDREDAYKYEAM